jgi:CRISPR-associated endoribonuclease Cas6
MNSDRGMMYSIAIQLSPTRPGTIRATVGHQAHAAFLRAVKEADPALAEVLHHPVLNQRPFTVSPLLGVGMAHDGEVAVSPERTYTLRFTVLYEPIFQQFMRRFLRGDRPVLRLGRVLFLIKEILATPQGAVDSRGCEDDEERGDDEGRMGGGGGWAGYTSFAELAAGAAERAAQPLIELEFQSPTAFSFGQRPWGKQFHVLPDPRLVFGSLARTWRAFAPPELSLEPRAVESYVDENVVIQRIDRLETRMLHFGRYPQVGFVGRVTYRAMDRSEGAGDWRYALHALADFAFYAGVGYKTTMGMGQCSRPR